ncbi:MAG: hypothetical protein Q9183_007388, partial [Haloplaca sp. 2 TL-2023]
MLTPVAFEDDPPTAVADSTTQNFQWGTPTQSAQPGSISSPDTPKMTSKAEAGETLPVDPRPKATQAQDPKPTNPATHGNPESGGNSRDAPGVPNDELQAPKQDVEAKSTSKQASPQDPHQDDHPPDPASNGPAGKNPAGVPSDGDTAGEDPTGNDPAGVPSGGDPAGNPAGGNQSGGDSAGNLAGADPAKNDQANNDPASNGPSGKLNPETAESGAEDDAALPDSNEDSQSPKEGPQDTPVTQPISPQDPKKDNSIQDAEQPPSGSKPSPVSPLPEVVVDTDPVYSVDNHELVPGGPAVTIDNVPYSLDPSASVLISGTKTLDLPQPSPILPAFEVGSHTYTANEASQYVVGDQTLIPGNTPVVVDQ